MRIGEAARQAGVSVHTLRFYESKGLLRTARSASNYRDYAPSAVERVAFIHDAQCLGFTLAEVRALVESRSAPMGCTELRTLGERKLAEIDAELARLQTMKVSIVKLLRQCDGAAVPTCVVRTRVERTRLPPGP